MVNRKLKKLFRRLRDAGKGNKKIDKLRTQAEACEPYPVFPPLPPRAILQYKDAYQKKLRLREGSVPKGDRNDKPLFALYRMYEYIVLDMTIPLREELRSFWWKDWSVADIPDPQDHDEPERYAVLSCIPALLVESYNRKIEKGEIRVRMYGMPEEAKQKVAMMPKKHETLPAWTSRVKPLKRTLHIPSRMPRERQLGGLDDPYASPAFKEKNILYRHPNIHFVSLE